MRIGLAALAALAFATSASAGSNTANPFAQDKATLNLAGLDLSTADGQQRLAIRMDQAARTVCGDRMASVHSESLPQRLATIREQLKLLADYL